MDIEFSEGTRRDLLLDQDTIIATYVVRARAVILRRQGR